LVDGSRPNAFTSRRAATSIRFSGDDHGVIAGSKTHQVRFEDDR
jgi:hypothetical protein